VPLTVDGPPARARTILFLASNPDATDRLALDEEVRAIEAKIRAADHRDSLALKTRWAVRADDLLQALNEDRPTVVHFSGHGEGRAGLVLHDEAGGSKLVPAAALRRLFATLKGDVRVVVLNACYSGEQAAAIAEEIDCVVGMTSPVLDDAARAFAASFYRALGFGHSVQAAFDQGALAVELAGIEGADVPRLLVRPGVSAGEVFVTPPAAGGPGQGRPAPEPTPAVGGLTRPPPAPPSRVALIAGLALALGATFTSFAFDFPLRLKRQTPIGVVPAVPSAGPSATGVAITTAPSGEGSTPKPEPTAPPSQGPARPKPGGPTVVTTKTTGSAGSGGPATPPVGSPGLTGAHAVEVGSVRVGDRSKVRIGDVAGPGDPNVGVGAVTAGDDAAISIGNKRP
jgi:hypothetical protein